MEVLVLQVFVSLCLVGAALLLFAFSSRKRDYEHADRLALAPLDADTAPLTSSTDEKGPR